MSISHWGMFFGFYTVGASLFDGVSAPVYQIVDADTYWGWA